MKKSAAEIREDLKAHVDFLTEAGAGFVFRRPDDRAGPADGSSGLSASQASPTGLPSLAERPPQTAEEREALEEIDRRVLVCTLCDLHRFRTHAVPGEGDRAAELMFIGEGPGRDEDFQGRPFVGRAGQLLRKIIAAMKFREDEVYITNMVKCRPPENRVPHHEEIEACSRYLIRQIELIRPKVIVTLGRTPTDHFVPGREGMTSRRGRFGSYLGIPVMPTFHPSYLVRNEGNRELKRMVWEDMQKVMALLGRK
ncbi:MAG TPA: uracil-DNA glycosylase [Acidobacteriota bacterium]|nr:uracil-DNA glycosylase [Acidobacteriota bacterium]